MDVGELQTKLTSLAKSIGNWQTNHFIPTRNELYKIHGEIYDLSLIIEDEAKLVNELNKQLDVLKVKYNTTTSIQLKLVKLTFHNIDRRKASSYAIPMVNAKEEGVPAGGYVDWLTEPLAKKESGDPSDDDTYAYVGIVGKRMKAKPPEKVLTEDESGYDLIAKLKPFDAVKEHVNTPQIGSYVLLVGYVNSTKETEVYSVIDKKSLVDSALGELKNQHKANPIENIHYNDEDDGVPVLQTTPVDVKTIVSSEEQKEPEET